MNKTIFLDRDGVLIADTHLPRTTADLQMIESVPQALSQLQQAGFLLIVVSNQTVVSRGLMSESDMASLQSEVERQIERSGGPSLDGFYYCPHHPNATVSVYRANCQCRKPRPGMLLRAANEHDIDLSNSFMIGDRITDIIAGARAGCRTVLVETGAHLAPPIESSEPLDMSIAPDHTCRDLSEAVDWILEGM